MLTSVKKAKKKTKKNKENNNNNNKMDALTNFLVQRAATLNQNCNLNNSFLSSLYVFVTAVFSLSLQCAQRQKKLYTQISSLSPRTL